METAKAWHIPPHEWDAMPVESRAEMMAFDQSQAAMQAYQDHIAERKRKADQAKRGARGKR